MSEQLDGMVIPKHVAMILDGNGRWAKKRGLPRSMGHREGCVTVEKTVEIVQTASYQPIRPTIPLLLTQPTPISAKP